MTQNVGKANTNREPLIQQDPTITWIRRGDMNRWREIYPKRLLRQKNPEALQADRYGDIESYGDKSATITDIHLPMKVEPETREGQTDKNQMKGHYNIVVIIPIGLLEDEGITLQMSDKIQWNGIWWKVDLMDDDTQIALTGFMRFKRITCSREKDLMNPISVEPSGAEGKIN